MLGLYADTFRDGFFKTAAVYWYRPLYMSTIDTWLSDQFGWLTTFTLTTNTEHQVEKTLRLTVRIGINPGKSGTSRAIDIIVTNGFFFGFAFWLVIRSLWLAAIRGKHGEAKFWDVMSLLPTRHWTAYQQQSIMNRVPTESRGSDSVRLQGYSGNWMRCFYGYSRPWGTIRICESRHAYSDWFCGPRKLFNSYAQRWRIHRHLAIRIHSVQSQCSDPKKGLMYEGVVKPYAVRDTWRGYIYKYTDYTEVSWVVNLHLEELGMWSHASLTWFEWNQLRLLIDQNVRGPQHDGSEWGMTGHDRKTVKEASE